jgi:hypothetical protein
MKIPVMGVMFDVDIKKKLPKGDHGHCDPTNRKILLAENKVAEIFESTKFHEVLHGILYVSGHSEWMTPEQEEGLVVALESAIMQICDLKKEYQGG